MYKPTEAVVLPDTTLCAIVRDEEVNPAGGIRDFVESIVPYVTAAVIVDTGSKDKTRQILEDCQSKYPHLKIYDVRFKGFSNARNFSLQKSPTERVLILDADERIKKSDLSILKSEIISQPAEKFHLTIYDVFYDTIKYALGLNPRVFKIKGGQVNFKNFRIGVHENSYDTKSKEWLFRDAESSKAKLWHFCTTPELTEMKRTQYYTISRFLFGRLNPFGISGPISMPFGQELKQRNPMRNNLEGLHVPEY